MQRLRRTPAAPCEHVDQIGDVARASDTCEQCRALGQRWVHLRMCLTCGQVGCCDSSKSKHATAHFSESGHPIMRSIEPGEAWLWCYVDERLVQQPAG